MIASLWVALAIIAVGAGLLVMLEAVIRKSTELALLGLAVILVAAVVILANSSPGYIAL